jgi:hypothetical protein
MDPSQVMRDDHGMMTCRECGYRYSLTPSEIVERSGSGVAAVRAALAGVPESYRGIRPSPEVWSVNAYAAHLADAAGVITNRIQAIAEQDRPLLPYHDQDQAVEEEHSDEQEAEGSLLRLEETVAAFRTSVTSLTPEQWDRVGVHARAGEVSLREIAHDMPHELEHHAMDMRRIGGTLVGDAETSPRQRR